MANLIINGDNNVVVSGNNNHVSVNNEKIESGFIPTRQLKYLITHYDGMGDVAITPICTTLEMAVNFTKRYVQDADDFDYTKGQIKEFKDTLLKNECYEDDSQNVFYPRLVEVSFIPRPIYVEDDEWKESMEKEVQNLEYCVPVFKDEHSPYETRFAIFTYDANDNENWETYLIAPKSIECLFDIDDSPFFQCFNVTVNEWNEFKNEMLLNWRAFFRGQMYYIAQLNFHG